MKKELDEKTIAKRAKQKEWALRNPEKGRATSMVTRAVKLGELTRLPCEVCGGLPAQAHHDDYSKPLDVRWLCKKHHDEHHVRRRKELGLYKKRGQNYTFRLTFPAIARMAEIKKQTGKGYSQVIDMLLGVNE